MATCSRCGQSIMFRYIEGRCIPIHPDGGCGGVSGSLNARDFSGYLHSEESTCFRTSCPECGESVFFIRYNGGSVWIEPPLGPPWQKHRCMDLPSQHAKGAGSVLVSQLTIDGFTRRGQLIVGVLKEAETARDGNFTLVNVVTGASENFYLAVKNKAGFLVGKLVIFDPNGKSLRWLEDQTYTFVVQSMVRVPKSHRDCMDEFVDCPECRRRMKAKNLGKHLRNIHSYITI